MKKHLLSVLLLFIVVICKAQSPILWGMAYGGGANQAGTIFYYNSATNTLTDVHDFGNDADGQSPYGSLVKANNSFLYGMTYAGGVKGKGTIFSYNIFADTEMVLHSFGNDSDGIFPQGSLIKASNGLMYGMVTNGGPNDTANGGGGIIFSYNTLTDTEIILHYFGSGADGEFPAGSLVQASNGLLYGTTYSGGANNAGAIFSYSISTGAETVLYSFKGGADGEFPYCSLIQVNDSMLYGMTEDAGGTANGGTIFSYTISTGKETNLHNFGNGTDGKNPYGSLLYASNRLIYGMAYAGGTKKEGMIFSYDISTGTESDVHDFGKTGDGNTIDGSMIQARNGMLYGMTSAGGANNDGIIFSFNSAADTEIDIHDFNYTEGANPISDLIEVDTTVGGINQLSGNNNQLSIYPNPSGGEINISSSKTIDEVKVFNLLGQMVYLSQPKQTKFIFELQEGGMYFFMVISGSETMTGKVVVNK